ncbi:hypothetical protein PENANT_c118G06293 [Penicillium antarcticum]|uniref:FAD/NAD(P)-binding domain-containing protein n=1 Tax=Penicillium antarcticum TaxID=416450 RepID=A0A1V6PIS0_9EURO|nr:hypothetical protein PENANT_c118G06293 [Penicillium antarcticum]
MYKRKTLYGDVIIIGAGLSGIDMACQLQRQLRIEWKGAQWVEASSKWHVYLCDLKTGEEFIHEAKVLISAVGGYTNPKFPVLPGLGRFEGPVVHTAQWNKEYGLRGLNVAVVGNGCLFTP